MSALPVVVTDSESAVRCPAFDERLPLSAATDSELREAARFVISPDGHADDASLQAAFKLLRAEAPVFFSRHGHAEGTLIGPKRRAVVGDEESPDPMSSESRCTLGSLACAAARTSCCR